MTLINSVKSRRIRVDRGMLPTLAGVVLLALMVIWAEDTYGNILALNTISSLFINNTHLIILSVAMTFVIITGGIDLSVGAVVAFSGVSGVMLLEAGWNPYLVMVMMVLIGASIGAVSGALVQFFDVQPFIATLATMFLARGLASVLSTQPVRVPAESPFLDLSTRIMLIDGPKNRDLTISPNVIITLAVVIAAVLLLHRTRTGRTVYALGGSEASAKLMGLPAGRTKFLVYILSGGLAGLAAVVYSSTIGTAQNITGFGWELDAIAATVIGGTLLTGGYGYVIGSFVGVLVLGLMRVILARDPNVSGEIIPLITGGILLIFVLLQRAVSGDGLVKLKEKVLHLLKPKTRSPEQPADEPKEPAQV